MIDFSFLITEAPTTLNDRLSSVSTNLLNFTKGSTSNFPKFPPNATTPPASPKNSLNKFSLPNSTNGPNFSGKKPSVNSSLASIARVIPSASKEGSLHQPDDGFTPDERLYSHINTAYIDPNNYKTHAEFIQALKDDDDKTRRMWAQATGGTGNEIGSGITAWIPGTHNSRLENRLEHNKELLDRYDGNEAKYNYEFLHGPKPDDPSFLQQYGPALGIGAGTALLGAGMYYGYKKYKDWKKRQQQQQWQTGN